MNTPASGTPDRKTPAEGTPGGRLMRRSVTMTPRPEAAQPDSLAVQAFREGEDLLPRTLSEVKVEELAPSERVVQLSRHELLVRDIAELYRCVDQLEAAFPAKTKDGVLVEQTGGFPAELKSRFPEKLKLREILAAALQTAPFFARAVDYVLSDRSVHLYGVAPCGEDGKEAALELNGAFRTVLASQVGAGTGGVPSLLRALCDPQDAESFLVSVWPSVLKAPHSGDGRINVFLKLKSVHAAETGNRAESAAQLRKLLQEVSRKVASLAATTSSRPGAQAPAASASADAKAALDKLMMVGGSLKTLDGTDLPAFAAALEKALAVAPSQDEYLSLSFIRIPDGVAFCGCVLNAEESIAAGAAARRFQYQEFHSDSAPFTSYARHALGVLRKVHEAASAVSAVSVVSAQGRAGAPGADASPSPDEAPSLAAPVLSGLKSLQEAVESISAEVLWPIVALIEEHPCPINLYAMLAAPASEEDERRYFPICYNRTYVRMSNLPLTEAAKLVRQGGDPASRIFDEWNFMTARTKLAELRVGSIESYDQAFKYKLTGSQVLFHTAMADAGSALTDRTTEVREGKDLTALKTSGKSVALRAPVAIARRSVLGVLPAGSDQQ